MFLHVNQSSGENISNFLIAIKRITFYNKQFYIKQFYIKQFYIKQFYIKQFYIKQFYIKQFTNVDM